jgi:hypothetical protein
MYTVIHNYNTKSAKGYKPSIEDSDPTIEAGNNWNYFSNNFSWMGSIVKVDN